VGRMMTSSIEDLSQLPVLEENIILKHLHDRFLQHKYYTYIADILVSINPFQTVDCYSNEIHEQYKNLRIRSSLEPHIFWLADNAYQRMRETGRLQCILVSGLSGSGKTESTKHMIRHISKQSTSHKQQQLANKITEVNPLLEAFGNAKTIMNDNSSRFGKYLELKFTEDGNLIGAQIQDFLLEKTRVIHQSHKEKNFHIFYYMFAGMTHNELSDYFLSSPEDFRILYNDNNRQPIYSSNEDFQHNTFMFHKQLNLLKVVGFTDWEISMIITILASVLHITNITLAKLTDCDSVIVTDKTSLHHVCKLLSLQEDNFEEALLTNTSFTRDERVIKNKTLYEATDGRDALAKALYARLFGWIVRQVNVRLGAQIQCKDKDLSSVAILDMSGFENAKVNSFEQLCINVANEQLQSYFNDHVFVFEQLEYKKERIPWRHISFDNNDDMLELFLAKPLGLFAIIDEESRFPKATDVSLLDKMAANSNNRKLFQKSKTNNYLFTIRHYTGQPLEYYTSGFLEKNRDNLSPCLLDCMKSSNNQLVSDMFLTKLSYRGTISDSFGTRKRIKSNLINELNTSSRRGSGEKSGDRNQTTVGQYFRIFLKYHHLDQLNMRKMEIERSLVMLQALVRGFIARRRYRRMLISRNQSDEIARRKLEEIAIDTFKPSTIMSTKKTNINDEPGNNIIKNLPSSITGIELAKKDSNIPTTMMSDNPSDKYSQLEDDMMEHKKRGKSNKGLLNDSSTGQGSTAASEDELDELRPNIQKKQRPRRFSQLSASNTSQSTTITNLSTITNGTKINNAANNQPWDVFKTVSRKNETIYESTTNWFEVAAKMFKIFTFIFLFVCVIGSALASKGSLLYMTWSIGNRNEYRDRWVYLVICTLCVPYAIMFLECLFKAMFGNIPWPSIGNMIWLLLIESLHSFGLCLFLFRVLPCLNTIRCLLLMNAVCQIPAILRLFATKRSEDKRRKIITIIFDFFAVLMQLTAIVVALTSMSTSCKQDKHHTTQASNVVGIDNGKNGAKQTTDIPAPQTWEIPVALILISVKWWENFFDKSIKIGRREFCVKEYKDSLYRVRVKAYILVSAWKIGLTFGFAFLLIPNLSLVSKAFGTLLHKEVYNCTNTTLPAVTTLSFLQSTVTTNNTFQHRTINCSDPADATNGCCQGTHEDPWWEFMTYLPLIIQIVSSGLCYYLARLACKLCMQRFSFAAPLCLVTPVAVGTLLAFYYLGLDNFLTEAFLQSPSMDVESDRQKLIWHIGIGFGLWWVSQLWVTRYIWTPKAPRLAFTEKLFILPLYCPGFIEQSLLLNRRRNDKERIPNRNLSDDISIDSNGNDPLRKQREQIVPKIYICATMWHETVYEMTQLLKSVFRMDIDQSARRNAQDYFNVQDPDFYEFEAHIFVDDAMEFNETRQWMPNTFVKQLVSIVDLAACAIHESEISLLSPIRIPTPYGGRLVWYLPGGNLLIVHFKDREMSRHKKRWSQVMYMYYLLGYRLLGQQDDSTQNNQSQATQNERWKHSPAHFVKGNIFKHIPEKTLIQAENTFILALDGDVDFKPGAVRLLVDRMKKSKKVGAACGRIHPSGSGPIVWYQIFEYAIGHWLQKAAEHMLGCVLCSPGCFSLFRGSALMDDNVMRTYATRSTDARHYLQYDQGEDRWLSTLLLQQGYRVEYCAASDAMTQTPEGFKEFFNQRRRWIPSTLANILDLLQSYRTTVKMNDNISYLYIAYQAALMLSTTLGPATVLLMMAGAFNAVIKTSLWHSYLLAIGPAVLYLILCFVLNSEYQVTIAAIQSAIYALFMMSVVVGTMVQIVEDSVVSPNAIFLLMLIAIFTISACFHPQEFLCLLPGTLYFLCIPSGYVLLIIYAMCNMHVVSWGTREKAAIPAAAKDDEKGKVSRNNSFMKWLGHKEVDESCCPCLTSFFRRLCGCRSQTDASSEILRQVMEKLEKVEAGIKMTSTSSSLSNPRRRRSSSRSRRSNIGNIEEANIEDEDSDVESTSTENDIGLDEIRDPLVNPLWLEDPELGEGEIQYLPEREVDFWQHCIAKYLAPIPFDKNHHIQMTSDLKSMRNNVAFAFFMLNAFWMIIIFMLQSVKDKISVPIPRPGLEPLKIEPLGLIFLVFFAFILILQFGAMLRHRYGTLLHILASTEIRCCRKPFDPKKHIEEAVEYARVLQRLHDYDDDTDQDMDYSMSPEGKSVRPDNNAIHSLGLANSRDEAYDSTRTTITLMSNLERSLPRAFESIAGRDGMKSNYGDNSNNREIQQLPPSRRVQSRHKNRHTGKNSTLRRAFVRRYTKLMRQQSSQSLSAATGNREPKSSHPSILPPKDDSQDYNPQFNQLNR
ncbi:chitin synthase chs-2-like, partial [Argonauta hians]